MTPPPRLPGSAAGPDLASGSAGADGAGSGAPVIVLTYGHAGAQRLQALLESQPELACTTATGLLAACEQAAATWRQAERRPSGVLSDLARSSIRALAGSMMTSITCEAGRPRWCEIAAAERAAAETFLGLFPRSRFVCLHRACPDVAFAVLSASPWGLSGPGFAACAAAYPGNRVAAVTAWWAEHAEPMLIFEQAHPGECLRLRYEDLAGNPAQTERAICGFLGLSGRIARLPMLPSEQDPRPEGALAPGCGAGMPVGQLPPPLLARVNELHARLGYPALQTAT
jgi:hypothetical protein